MAVTNVLSLVITAANSFFFMHMLQKTRSLFTDLEGNVKSWLRGTLR